MDEYPEEKKIPFVRKLCAHKSEVEIREAEENLRRFLRSIDRLYEELQEKRETNPY